MSTKLTLTCSRRGYTFDYSYLFKKAPNVARRICKDLTLSEIAGIGKWQKTIKHPIYKQYKNNKGRKFMIVPWGYISKLATFVDLQLVEKDRPLSRVDFGKSSMKLYPNQEVVFDKIMSGEPSSILIMDTGYGKTYVGGAIAAARGLRSLVVTHNTRGWEEWTKMFTSCFPELRLGSLSGTNKKQGDVVVSVVNSLLRPLVNDGKSKVPTDKFLKQFDFVIFDEVTEYTGAKSRELFWKTQFKYKLGLTATPNEKTNGLDDIYRLHLGKFVIANEIPGFCETEVKWNCTVDVIKYHGPPKHTKSLRNKATGYICSSYMAEQYVTDPYRNKLVLAKVDEYYSKGKNIFIFSEKRSILEKFAESVKLDTSIVTSDEDLQTLMGGATAEEFESAKKARIILVTYQYASKGVSIIKMDCIIFLTPRRNNMMQIIGRILRLGGDIKAHRYIVDIVDMKTSLKNQYTRGWQRYKRNKLTFRLNLLWDGDKSYPVDGRRVAYEIKGFNVNESTLKYGDITDSTESSEASEASE